MNPPTNLPPDPPPNTALTSNNGLVADELADGYCCEDLHCAVSLVEDWLLHASPETLDELGDFVYGAHYRGHDDDHDGHDGHDGSPDQLRWIIEGLGVTAVRLRPPRQAAAAPPAAAADPATIAE
jgi:hypothetical protein